MKIEELIDKLQEIQVKEGNITVEYDGGETDRSIFFLDLAKHQRIVCSDGTMKEVEVKKIVLRDY